MRRRRSIVAAVKASTRWRLAAFIAVLAAPFPLLAQGPVSGRVAMQEKPGETTKDFDGTVIYLTPKGAPAHFSATKAHMAMSGRQFAPHVRVITTGSTVEYANQDPFSHNIFSTAPGAAFDLGTYGSGIAKSTAFTKPGAFPVYCNIHAQMTAVVVVVSTPYYTQAGADARWTIPKVPAGKYELHIWHERAPAATQDVDVPVAGLTGVDVTLDARGFKQVAHKNKLGKDYAANGVRY
jgi:plastocyanin